jgi:membrane protein implicated in regulation of membrane protease activity
MDKKTEFLISITTGLLLVYTVMAALPIAFAIVFFLFLVVSALIIWMVIAILKDTSRLSDKKFDDYFYEDSSIKRSR